MIGQSTKKRELFLVDAFASKAFSGNPAGVLICNEALPNQLMQNIAMELSLSETAFVVPNKTRGFNLRWFTPTTEVKLCGHATLSAAHILYERQWVATDETIEFHTLSGILKARREAAAVIALDFPKRTAKKIPSDSEVERALGKYSIGQYRTDEGDVLVELAHEADVRSLSPDINALAKIEARGVIVTAASAHRDIDFTSRFFAPRCGVPEDPVTGSAHCALFPHWGQKLRKTKMNAYQASRRGGYIQGEVLDGDRVMLKGQAITMLELKAHDAFFG